MVPTAQKHILVVDDDPRICRLLTHYLAPEGYRVSSAASGAEMRQRTAGEMPDLVVLDMMLPDTDGFTLARELRAASNVGIIMLTGKTDQVDKVASLEAGADDYVTKPFDKRELLARIRSVLRRTEGDRQASPEEPRAVARFAGWTLDLVAHELISPEGGKVTLTSHEFRLLTVLVERSNRVLSRDSLLDLLAGRDWNPYDRSVDAAIGKLRKKIERDPKHPALIQTIRGEGYKFTARVAFSES